MLEINLLPWRAAQRAQKKKKRYGWLLAFLSVFIGIFSVIYLVVSHQKGVRQMAMSKQTQINHSVSQADQLLKKIQFIAYLNRGNRVWAMLIMPSGVIVDVRVGSDMGIAGARVASVSRDKVVLALPDNRLYSIVAMS